MELLARGAVHEPEAACCLAQRRHLSLSLPFVWLDDGDDPFPLAANLARVTAPTGQR